ncbi:Uncharacterised protein [Clostridioides difficile]|uniref:DUF1146 domain-containing protein n=2 Tax=Clostridioides difficile TaxID=1496 RepID=A0AAX3GW63_CLODI|nr:hypothetical protein CDIF29020_02149 [Clostridioides difficile]EFH07308.1 hypothetical protein HMPREF0220_1620 [Clostridioides difficile NAP08]SHO36997.1 hypothetical protein CDIFFM120_02090 [Clostridioides difficile M120]AXU90573.1 hypothetical protein CDIF29747_02066 [Clostridioides difficile]OMK40230.1 hypothetical protein BER34_001869 [Clostridioides difficile]
MDYYPMSKYLITFLIATFVFIPINFICQKIEKRFKLNGFKKFLFYLFTFFIGYSIVSYLNYFFTIYS